MKARISANRRLFAILISCAAGAALTLLIAGLISFANGAVALGDTVQKVQHELETLQGGPFLLLIAAIMVLLLYGLLVFLIPVGISALIGSLLRIRWSWFYILLTTFIYFAGLKAWLYITGGGPKDGVNATYLALHLPPPILTGYLYWFLTERKRSGS